MPALFMLLFCSWSDLMHKKGICLVLFNSMCEFIFYADDFFKEQIEQRHLRIYHQLNKKNLNIPT